MPNAARSSAEAMVVASCACGGSSHLPKKIRGEHLEDLALQTRLKPAEVKALYARFRRLAPAGYLLPEQFKQTMGALGLSDDPFLPDRMFRVFDHNQDGKLSFFEFASSLAVMIRGTEDEKLKLSFEMAAGRRGAEGIELEDFQHLVSACNTMMSSLVAPSRHLTTNEDATRLFHDLATDGSSDEEAQTVITLDAYKRAAQNNLDFLACLGLEPHPGKRNRGVTRANTGSFSAPPPWTPSPLAPAQVTVSATQIEELRARVTSLRRMTARQRHQPAELGWEASSPSQPATPPAADDCSDRWWSPACWCTPPRRHDGPPSSASHHRRATALPPEEFEEVVEELDGIISWCAQHSEAPQDGDTAANAGSGGGLPSAGAPVRAVCGLPTPREVSRQSREGGIEPMASRPNVHAPSINARTVQPVPSASNSSQGRAPRSRAATQSSRQRKKHRLLGPKNGLAVHFGHENWNMVLSMMIGIRMSVGRSKHEVARELQPVDFIMKEKFSIIPRLANIFDSTVSKRVTMTRFIDYAPMVFQRIRSSFGIQHDDYLRSVGPEQLLGNMVLGNLSSLSELSSEGKSGAFFYYTADGKYMMKTVTPQEHKLLKRMLKRYFDHIMQNPGTLIVRFLGLHGLRVHKERKAGGIGRPGTEASRKLYFVVMGNMFNTPFDIHRRYDLKGSWVGRSTPTDAFDPSVALKDVDFKRASEAIRVGDERRASLVAQIESDSGFLRDNNIIDYSLLLGIYEIGTTTITAGTGPSAEDTASETGSERGLERPAANFAAPTQSGTAAPPGLATAVTRDFTAPERREVRFRQEAGAHFQSHPL